MKLIDKNKIIKKINMNMIAVLPTDTVYGIMAKFNRENEIKINKFKNSDINKKISVIFYNKKELFNYIEKLSFFRKLIIKILLPGKYTFIVDLKKEYALKSGFDRIDFGVRVTKCKELQTIIKKTGPLLATSCNKSKEEVYKTLSDLKKIKENIFVYYTKDLKNKPSKIIKLNSKNIEVIR